MCPLDCRGGGTGLGGEGGLGAQVGHEGLQEAHDLTHVERVLACTSHREEGVRRRFDSAGCVIGGGSVTEGARDRDGLSR